MMRFACSAVSQPKGEQPAGELRQDLIEVRESQRGADDLSGVLVFGDHRPVLIQHGLEVFGVVADLLLGEWDEPPVALPAGVVDLQKPRDLLL
jgi:hypothetical protein